MRFKVSTHVCIDWTNDSELELTAEAYYVPADEMQNAHIGEIKVAGPSDMPPMDFDDLPSKDQARIENDLLCLGGEMVRRAKRDAAELFTEALRRIAEEWQ